MCIDCTLTKNIHDCMISKKKMIRPLHNYYSLWMRDTTFKADKICVWTFLSIIDLKPVYQAGWSGRPKLPRQFVTVWNFEPRLFVPMPGNMGRPAFTFINLYIFCNLQRIINIHLGYVCIYFLIRNSFVCWQAH